MVPVSLGQPGASGGGGADCPELAHVCSALARSMGLEEALNDAAIPATGQVGMVCLGQWVCADVDGAGPTLQSLIETEGVADALVGGGRTWIDWRRDLESVSAAAMDESEVRALAVRMAASAYKCLGDACLVADAILSDDIRLNVVLLPLSADGTLISLCTKRRRDFTLDKLTAADMVASGLDRVLAALVTGHASCLVTGVTGTGKTTLLAALLSLVPATERIVCVEEAGELRPDHPYVVRLQECGANVQGVGAVATTSLVRIALRMRSDRIMLGECRGPEVCDALAALNTGCEGGWATLHANSPADVPARLIVLRVLAGLNEVAVATRAASVPDAVVHLRRQVGTIGARRYVASIGVLRRGISPAGVVFTCEEILHVTGDGRPRPGSAVSALRERIGLQVLARIGLDALPGAGERRSV